VKLKVKQETIMKKSLLPFLFGVGLVLVTTSPAFAQADNLPLGSGTATLAFNNRTSLGGPTGPVAPNSHVGSAYSATANYNPYGGATTTTVNMGSATLAGALTLLLLQRRYHHMLS
jgi:hypothetical protein